MSTVDRSGRISRCSRRGAPGVAGRRRRVFPCTPNDSGEVWCALVCPCPTLRWFWALFRLRVGPFAMFLSDAVDWRLTNVRIPPLPPFHSAPFTTGVTPATCTPSTLHPFSTTRFGCEGVPTTVEAETYCSQRQASQQRRGPRGAAAAGRLAPSAPALSSWRGQHPFLSSRFCWC